MFVDGAPLSGVIVGFVRNTGDGAAGWREAVAAHRDAGLRVLNTCNSGSGPQPVFTDDGRGDELDFDEIDRRTHKLLDVHPDALLLTRVWCGAMPERWYRENPDELVLYHDGSTQGPQGPPQPSRSSEKWHRDAGAIFRSFLDHVEQSDYADNVLGYVLMHAGGGEWYNPASFTQHWADYSEVSKARFRHWLARKYGCTAELRKAWNDPDATLETAEIPTVSQRLECGGTFRRIRDPQREQNVVDWYTFYALENNRALSVFAHQAKDASQGRRLVGTFFGYIMAHAWCPGALQESGHLALREYLANPEIDFVVACTTYPFRAAGSGSTTFPLPVQSVRRAGKVYIDEADIRTHLTPIEYREVGTYTVEDTVQVLRRQLGAVFSESIASWGLTPQSHNDAATMATIRQLNAIGERLLDFDRTRCSEIAYVCDQDSLLNTGLGAGLGWNFLEGQNIEMTRIGAPVDRLMTEDLSLDRPYKLYIFPCSYRMTSAQRERILQLLREQQSTALWMYTPGYIIDGCKDVSNITALTGFDVKEPRYHYVGLARTTGQGTHELSRRIEFGSPYRLAPLMHILPGSHEVIGKSEDTGLPALVRRRMPDGWTSVYATVGPLKGAILRALARDAGVHIYLEEDDFFNANNVVCVLHARDAGEKEIRLRTPGDLYDLLNDRQLAAAASSVKVALHEGQTGIYFFGSQETWQGKEE